MSYTYRAIKNIYNRFLRDQLPRKIGVYNTIPVRRPRLLDQNDVFPDYEATLVDQIKQWVRDGDTVIIVGGGFGVSTVHAARQASTVTTYEVSLARTKMIKETININGVMETVTVCNKAIGNIVYSGNDLQQPEIIPASELSSCDLLILDCEGAERNILESMDIRPSRIIVETHPMFEVHPTDIRKILDELGYEIIAAEKEETVNGPICIFTALLVSE